MLVDQNGSVSSSLSGGRIRVRLLAGAGLFAAATLLVVAQVWASGHGTIGPLRSLLDDYLGNPQSAAVSWAGLALAGVGVPARTRTVTLAAAVGLELLVLGLQEALGWHVSIGTGPTLALTALAVTVLPWPRPARRTALRAIGLGALLIMASKLADTWLIVSIAAGPQVLDQYVQLADRALGEPSWVLGRLLAALGPAPTAVLHAVYIQLPLAAVVVAIRQLRAVTTGPWPRHNLVRTFLVLGIIGPLGYVLFPVVGPIFAYGDWPHVLPAVIRPAPMAFDAVTARNCMPSMHVAWATALFIHSRTAPPWLRGAGTLWLLGTILATLGFGYHYGCDLVAGAVLCLTVESALRDPERGWNRYRIRIVALGVVTLAGLLLSYRFLAASMAAYPVAAGCAVVGALIVVSVVFHATWFARPGSRPARWGGRLTTGATGHFLE